MIYNLEILFMMFIIYAIAGWIMECTLGVIEKHKFVNRGFLIGPYCPIYGVGVVTRSLTIKQICRQYSSIIHFSNTCMWNTRIFNKLFHGKNISCKMVGLQQKKVQS